MPNQILNVQGLETRFLTDEGTVHAINGVSFTVNEGETVGIVGESGSGKSVTMLSVLRLIPTPPGKITAGTAEFRGQDLLKMKGEEIRHVRGAQISMIFQDPMTSLNPVLTIGKQLTEPMLLHLGMTKQQANNRAVELLEMVGIPGARERLSDYPHQFSGGMMQRAMIAMALSCNPQILIADEPTTALDVTIQAQFIELVKRLQENLGMAIIWITHDLGVIAGLAQRVLVMYGGLFIEKADVKDLYADPRHPYTIGLLGSLPRLDGRHSDRLVSIDGCPRYCMNHRRGARSSRVVSLPSKDARKKILIWKKLLQTTLSLVGLTPALGDLVTMTNETLLRVDDLVKHFPIYQGVIRRQVGAVHAVDGVSFEIYKGETFGLVGESGCGKSTTGRTIIRLYKPTDGHVYYDGTDLASLNEREMRKVRRKLQIIFQDPYASLNPRMRVEDIVGEPLLVHKVATGKEIKERVKELLKQVGLNPAFADRYPHEFSGGQRQRISVARSLALQPDLIICDEPISALDVSIQAQVINLLEDLQEQFGLTYMFIAHDLSVVRHISDRVAVMYLGIIVELAERDELYEHPLHPYSQALLSAVPIPDPIAEERRQRVILEGDVPSPVNPPSGCRFRTRCPIAEPLCTEEKPEWREIKSGHFVACHFSERFL